ncbi:M23 family metallopeptidase [Lutispora thermophila]|uniref:Peptidase family M23 n=1 Tax=Lutispora thermophila DSM 19022 TaxID=1122184 RepID=A0A1M6ANT6_9FIRM|nr:M23 family metallopeptidase [Lutispora thermophila]SHI37998.1 Peptidase family M23 [Lutispora thermophila DSM 19022]
MKFNELLSKRKIIIPVVIIIIAMLATVGAWQYKRYLDNKFSGMDFERGLEEFEDLEESEEDGEEKNSFEGSISIVEEEPTEQAEGSREDITEVNATQPSQPKISEKKSEETAVTAIKLQEPKVETMLAPVFGTISLDYSDSQLVYSKTLDMWTTHEGLDIKAEEGSQVRAVMDGIISEVTNDPQWGMTIAIDHGGGVTTIYSNLSTLDMVTVGQEVKKGDVISGVGKTAIIEIAEEPHLHFEIMKDGKSLDPKIYLPKQSLKR